MHDDKHIEVDDRIVLMDKVDPSDPASWVVAGEAIVDMVIEKRFGDVTEADMLSYGNFDSRDAMMALFRQYYGRDVSWQTPIKMIHFRLDKQGSSDNIDDSITTSSEELKLYADGGSRGNPGPSAAGYVLYTMRDELVMKRGEYLGVTTNNQAEYLALRMGLEEAKRRGARRVHVYLDSLLVVNQMRGIFKVKNRDLWGVHEATKQLVGEFEKVNFTHVPRELNKVADGEVNVALDDHGRQEPQKNV